MQVVWGDGARADFDAALGLVIYRIHEDRIEIRAVVHASQRRRK